MNFRRVVLMIVLGLGIEALHQSGAGQGVGWAEEQGVGQDVGAIHELPLPEVETYDQLLSAIRKVRKETQERIEEAVERENVREAWLTGKLIDAHVLHHKRAEYGKKVLLRLSEDLNTSDEELSFMLQFARAYPISWPAKKLSWSHWQTLLSINDDQEREELANEAERQGWTRDRVRDEVKKRKAAKKQQNVGVVREPFLQATPGKVGTYRIVKATAGPLAGERVVDLGFSNYYRPPGKFSFKEGDIVEIVGAGSPRPGLVGAVTAPLRQKGWKIKKSKRTQDDGPARDLQISAGRTQTTGDEYLFTYPAYVTHLQDGDTFTAVIDLGFGFNTVQTLRLRGLDAPEMEGREGKEAKEFLDSRLKHSGMTEGNAIRPILIRTTKSDKYDRYLVDVFLPRRNHKISRGGPQAVELEGGEAYLYVNQELVSRGLASVVPDS